MKLFSIFAFAGLTAAAADLDSLRVVRIPIEKRWDKPVPTVVPEVPVVLKEGIFYGDSPNHPVLKKDETPYTPLRAGGFMVKNGPRYFNRPLFYKGNMIGAGDRPMFLITRGYGKQWASKLRFAFGRAGLDRWLDQFPSITTEFWPGHVQYICEDPELQLTVKLTAAAGMEGHSSLFAMEVNGAGAPDANAKWVYGDVVNESGSPDQMWWLPKPELGAGATNTVSLAGPRIARLAIRPEEERWKRPLSVIHLRNLEFYAGSDWPNETLSTEGTLAAGSAVLKSGWRGTVVVVWGGPPNRDSLGRLENDMRRLKLAWGDALHAEWYENFVGRASRARESFDKIIASPDQAMAESRRFWETIRQRIQFQFPDDELTAWANWLAATQEYLHWPLGQMSSLDVWGQAYLHISNMYSGWDYLGVHDQQQKWMRLFATSVRNGWIGLYHGIAPWAGNREFAHGGEEDQIAHYVNYVYTHWLWTADRAFVSDVWPSVKELLERELMQNDPDGDGLFAARYPYWGPENDTWGPATGLQTAQVLRALKGAAELADVVKDVAAQRRYSEYAARSKNALTGLWDASSGVLGWRDPLGVLHTQPGAQETFLPILRGAVDAFQSHQMLRYVRENLWSEVHPGTARIWLCGDVGGRHHLGPLPDVSWSTVAAAGISGAIDDFYPVLKTYAHSYFFSSWPGGEGSGVSAWGSGSAGMNDHNDGRMPALYLLGRGLFGLEPDYPRNRLTIEPRFPSHWKSASVSTPDLRYEFSSASDSVTIDVSTAKAVAKTLRLPVLREVTGVTIDGRRAEYKIEPAVNRAFVVVDAPQGNRNVVVVKTLTVELRPVYEKTTAVGAFFTARVEGARTVELFDPQQALSGARTRGNQLEASPSRAGKRTAFLKATAGSLDIYFPLELTVAARYSIHNPSLDRASKTLTLEVSNPNRETPKRAVVRFRGETHNTEIRPQAVQKITVSVGARARSAVLPGSNPVEIEIDGAVYRHSFIDWQSASASDKEWWPKAVLLDMAWEYHEEANSLFNTKFYYDAWQMGIDYPVLPHATYEWAGHALENPKLSSSRFVAAGSIPFYLASERKLGGVYQPREGGGPRNVLPVANWRPGLYPSNLVIPLNGARLSKAYFLAYSWQRGHKTYHPNVELVANYADGASDVRQLIPPYNFMPQYGLTSVSRNAYQPEVIPAGLPLSKEKEQHWYLSRREKVGQQADIYDLPLDPTRPLKSIEVRSVATESIFAIFGITLVQEE